MRVCLIIEGAYPYIQGGMSNWVQQLMLSMPDVEFVVQSIAADRTNRKEFKYKIPPNCLEIEEIYLQDDDYVGLQTQKKLRMSDREYFAFEGLLFGAKVDWDSIFQFFDRRNVSLNALLTGKDFLSMTLNYYQKHYVRVTFTDFLWSMRSMYLPLFSILKSRPMKADFYHSASAGYAGVLGSMQRSLYNKPFLMSEHGFYTREREEEIIKADWVQGVYKDLWIAQFHKIGDCCYRYADKVTSLYADGRRIQIESGCPEHKTLVIPNGINPMRFNDVAQKAGDDSHIILPSFYVGLTMVGVISLIMALPVMWSLYYRGGVDLPFILLAYVFWTSAVLIFFTITYLHAIGATYNRIQMYKRIMFRTLSQQMIHVFGIQISITSVLFMVVMLLGRQYFTGMTMEIYPVLAASYLGIFMMYDNIVYLYYFEDRAGALLTAMVYFACTLAGSWWSKELAVQFFGLGAFLGMLAGWTFSFFRIRYVERNIEVLIYCRHKIIDTVRSSAKGKTVYQKAKGWGHRQ